MLKRYIQTLLCWAIFCQFQLATAATVNRVITLSPHATELAYAAGLGNKIIAVSDHSDYPPAARTKLKVANYRSINIEKILTLHPDLVIAWPAGNAPQALNKLKQMGIRLFYATTTSLDDIANNIQQLAQYADDPQPGQQQAQHFRQTLAALRAHYRQAKPVRYFYQLSDHPIITIAQGSWPSEVFTLCGGVNVFADSPAHYPQVGLEQVILARPTAIFHSRHAINDPHMWDQWTQIPAIQHHYVWTLNSDWLNRPTPRTLKAIKQVCQYLDQIRQNH